MDYIPVYKIRSLVHTLRIPVNVIKPGYCRNMWNMRIGESEMDGGSMRAWGEGGPWGIYFEI